MQATTLLLRPFNFETLATHIYSTAALDPFGSATLGALTIALIGLVRAPAAPRRGGRPRRELTRRGLGATAPTPIADLPAHRSEAFVTPVDCAIASTSDVDLDELTCLRVEELFEHVRTL